MPRLHGRCRGVNRRDLPKDTCAEGCGERLFVHGGRGECQLGLTLIVCLGDRERNGPILLAGVLVPSHFERSSPNVNGTQSKSLLSRTERL